MARVQIPPRGKSRFSLPEEKIKKKPGRKPRVKSPEELVAETVLAKQVKEVRKEVQKVNINDLEDIQKEYDALKQNIVEVLGQEAYKAACKNIKDAIKDGNLEFSKFLLEQIIVKPKAWTPIRYKFGKLETVNDISTASAKLLHDMGEGLVSMEEAEFLETRLLKHRECVFQSKVETAIMGAKMSMAKHSQTTSLMNLFN